METEVIAGSPHPFPFSPQLVLHLLRFHEQSKLPFPQLLELAFCLFLASRFSVVQKLLQNAQQPNQED